MTKFIANAVALLICATMMSLVASTSAIAAQRPLTLTEAQNGKTIAIDNGALLIIALESNPSTGYSWRISKNDNAVLKFIDQTEFPPRSPTPGAPGSHYLKFKAMAPGNDNLKLEYQRPWEKGVSPVKKFSIVVTVK